MFDLGIVRFKCASWKIFIQILAIDYDTTKASHGKWKAKLYLLQQFPTKSMASEMVFYIECHHVFNKPFNYLAQN